jgi:class 3 adenylate cyclase
MRLLGHLALMPVIPRAGRLLPTGTVTFLFTDIEGSTRLWETQHAAARAALGDDATF